MILHALQIEEIRRKLVPGEIPTWTPVGPQTGVHAFRVKLSPESPWANITLAPPNTDWHYGMDALSFVDPGQIVCTDFHIGGTRMGMTPFDPAMWHSADGSHVRVGVGTFSAVTPLDFRFELDQLDIAMMDLLIVVQALDHRLCRTPKHA